MESARLQGCYGPQKTLFYCRIGKSDEMDSHPEGYINL